jgi:hypothetical protein
VGAVNLWIDRGVLRGSPDGCSWMLVSGVATAPAFDVVVTASGAETTAFAVGGMPRRQLPKALALR